MLKIYDVISMYKLNDGNWQKCGGVGYCCKDDSEIELERTIFEDYNFGQCRDFLRTHCTDGLWNYKTLFRHCLMIGIESKGLHTYISEKELKSISYKLVYKERENVTLDWIIKHCTADQTITYLKQRGIQTCPILK